MLSGRWRDFIHANVRRQRAERGEPFDVGERFRERAKVIWEVKDDAYLGDGQSCKVKINYQRAWSPNQP